MRVGDEERKEREREGGVLSARRRKVLVAEETEQEVSHIPQPVPEKVQSSGCSRHASPWILV